MAKIRRVPWQNKDEWLEVYDKLQGSYDLEKLLKATQHMELWIERGHCPPAVEYTCRFIKPMCQDPHFFPSVSNAESDENLQAQYGASILRFINILGEVESEKSLSLNARALKIGLPEWVVNTRHQISHGSSLPSMDILRISVDSLLKWLKINYWDVEKEGMADLTIPNASSIFEDKLTTLLNIYAHLTGESDRNIKLVRDIRNDEVKNQLTNVGDMLYHKHKQEMRTWEVASAPSVGSFPDCKQLLLMSVPSAVTLVIRTIKPYFEHERAEAVKIFVGFLVQEFLDEGVCSERWQQLLTALHSRGIFPSLLEELIKNVCSSNKSKCHVKPAAEWTIFLLKSLLKRLKMQRKLDLIAVNSIPTSKKLKLNLTEKEKSFIIKDKLKHQLSIETKTNESDEVHGKLFEVIERKNPCLKQALRLLDPKFLSESEVIAMTRMIFSTPNEYTSAIAELLVDMSTSLNKSVPHLLNLMKFKMYNAPFDIPKNQENIFDCISLAQCLLPATQTHKFMEIVDD